MKKVLAFDLDGTLAPSKSAVPDEICLLLGKLLEQFHVCVISGGKFEQFQDQLLANLKIDKPLLKSLHIMPTCGTRYYAYQPSRDSWDIVYAEDLSKEDKAQIIKSINTAVSRLGFDKHQVYGPQIEDRGSQISWSALGQDIVDELGEEGVRLKETWDADNKKKNKIRDEIAPLIQQFEVRVGGLTTIDITKLGIDKAYGMNKLINQLSITKRDILFFGDKLQPGGNDFPVKEMGIDCLEVSNWHDTVLALTAIHHVA